jgi:hypothetical protein
LKGTKRNEKGRGSFFTDTSECALHKKMATSRVKTSAVIRPTDGRYHQSGMVVILYLGATA